MNVNLQVSSQVSFDSSSIVPLQWCTVSKKSHRYENSGNPQCVRCVVRGQPRCRAVSRKTHTHDRGVIRIRQHRHGGAQRRARTGRWPRADRGDRQSSRRRGFDCGGNDRQSATRWLHVADDQHQPRGATQPARQAAVRSAQGFRGSESGGADAQPAAHACLGAGEERKRIDRSGEGATGQTQLCIGHQRFIGALGR